MTWATHVSTRVSSSESQDETHRLTRYQQVRNKQTPMKDTCEWYPSQESLTSNRNSKNNCDSDSRRKGFAKSSLSHLDGATQMLYFHVVRGQRRLNERDQEKQRQEHIFYFKGADSAYCIKHWVLFSRWGNSCVRHPVTSDQAEDSSLPHGSSVTVPMLRSLVWRRTPMVDEKPLPQRLTCAITSSSACSCLACIWPHSGSVE